LLVPPAISASPLGALALVDDAPVGGKVLGTLVHTSGLLVKAPMRVGSASVGVLDGGRALRTLLQLIVLLAMGAILQAQSSLAVSLEKVRQLNLGLQGLQFQMWLWVWHLALRVL
jgi:hypothetical protein